MQRFVWILSICALPLFVKAQTTPPAAKDVLKTAEAKAAKEHKNVLVMFHASWCHWCHEMDTAIADPACKPFFDRNYVIEHLTVFESKGKEQLQNPGAEDMLKELKATEQGIPFWLIYDAKGTVLADSRNPKTGNNMGCPNSGDELEQLKAVLSKTGKGTPAELEAIAARFKATAK